MNAILAALLTLRNKLVAIIVLVILGAVYRQLPTDSPVPFAEVLYAVILVLAVIVVGPLVRVLVFNEAARYAESGKLDKDLAYGQETLAYKHYRLATVISYATALVCVSSVLG